MKKVDWIDLYPHEFFEEMAKNPVCYMAYAPAEPHGVYNTFGVDYYNSNLLLRRAAQQHGGILAPAMVWHIQEQPYYDWEMDCCGMGMSLSTSISEELFLHNMLYHVRTMDTKGFKAAILLSGHYLGGLNEDMRMLIEYYLRRTGSPIRIWGGYVNELDYPFLDSLGLPPSAQDHAGILETSMVMALKPESVDLDLYDVPPNVPDAVAGNSPDYGYYCCPKGMKEDLPYTTRALGEQVVDRFIGRIGEIKQKLLNSYKERERRYVTITETEEIWHAFCYLTRKYWRCVQTREEAEKGIVLQFPGFDALEGKR